MECPEIFPSIVDSHRLWAIDELIRNVLAHLPPGRRLSTLASCARVSPALSEPALDLLWSKLSGLMPLFKLISSSSREVPGIHSNAEASVSKHLLENIVAR